MKLSFKLILLLLFIMTISCKLFAEEEFSNTALKSDNLKLPYENQYYNQETSFDSKIDEKDLNEISEGPIRKLGRGFSNVIFGVFEILIEPYEVNEKNGGVAACTYGLIKGIFYFLAREGVGIAEILTFPFPLPGASSSGFGNEWGYGPLMQPEWVFDLDRNPYNFIYHDDPL